MENSIHLPSEKNLWYLSIYACVNVYEYVFFVLSIFIVNVMSLKMDFIFIIHLMFVVVKLVQTREVVDFPNKIYS